jgi:colanic acid biosynthesis glycosyl transferase WcaI
MIYRRFQVVSTISNTMLKKVQEKGVLPEKTILFPNWIDTNEIYPLKGINPFREKLGLTSKDNVVLYSGSMGVKQGIDILVKVARCMQHILNLHFVICGDGPAKIGLMETARGLPNVHFLPLQSVEKLNFLLNLADIHVLPQKSDASDLVMPSKLLGILASGKPVIASCNFDSELGRIVETVGYRVPPENVMALAEAIEYLILNPSIRRALGVGGRTFVCEQFSREIVLELFEKQLLNLSKF